MLVFPFMLNQSVGPRTERLSAAEATGFQRRPGTTSNPPEKTASGPHRIPFGTVHTGTPDTATSGSRSGVTAPNWLPIRTPDPPPYDRGAFTHFRRFTPYPRFAHYLCTPSNSSTNTDCSPSVDSRTRVIVRRTATQRSRSSGEDRKFPWELEGGHLAYYRSARRWGARAKSTLSSSSLASLGPRTMNRRNAMTAADECHVNDCHRWAAASIVHDHLPGPLRLCATHTEAFRQDKSRLGHRLGAHVGGADLSQGPHHGFCWAQRGRGPLRCCRRPMWRRNGSGLGWHCGRKNARRRRRNPVSVAGVDAPEALRFLAGRRLVRHGLGVGVGIATGAGSARSKAVGHGHPRRTAGRHVLAAG